MTNICPVCGYPHLSEPAYDDGEPSYDTCVSCGFEFGFDDDSEGFTHEQWREKWIKEGMRFWWEKDKPENWDPKKQLLNIGIKV